MKSYPKQHLNIAFAQVTTSQLSPEDLNLLNRAREASTLAYAPYSKFHVGAAALLKNGEVALGSNKENASFPAGICAERNVLNYVSDQFPGQAVTALAIHANPLEFQIEEPVSPCGVCRQVMCETEQVQGSSMRVLLSGAQDQVLVFESAATLLPFHFYLKQLKQ